MKKILIFAGTTEGRELTERLSQTGLFCEVCVATEYGEQVLEPSENVLVRQGRLTREEMTELFDQDAYLAVVDATHPFATVVTENIISSLQGRDIPYLRLARDVKTGKNTADCHYYNSTEECAEALLKTEGTIFLTTGSKELAVFCQEESLKNRLVVRVLPGKESLELCYENGLEGKQIIAMQGPFTKEMNLATMHQYQVSCLVTKESGRTGGVDEKLQAAMEAGIPCHVIRKPGQSVSVQEYSLQEVYEKVLQLAGLPVPEKASLQIVLAGIGMGSGDSRTIALQKVLQQTDYLFGAARMIEGINPKKEKFAYYLLKDILPVLERIQKENTGLQRVCILFSGDTGFFSGCEKLYQGLKVLENAKVTVLPGISSLSALAAGVGVNWSDVLIISAHGVEKEKWIPKVLYGIRQGRKVFLLTSGPEDLQKVGEVLIKAKLSQQVSIHVGYQLSYPEEHIFAATAQECLEIQKSGLYVGLLIPEEGITKAQITPGWKDEAFLRDKVPMTKEEVREISIAKMGLTRDAVVYDIGSGTGSVALEMAALSPEIQVYAIECNPDAVRLIQENMEHAGIYNISLKEGMAPEVLSDLPTPTHAFIGGSRGNLKEILDALYAKNPEMRVVMNAISMESICRMQELLKAYPLKEYDIVNVSVSRAKKVGDYHLMQAGNPVMIFSFTFGQMQSDT